jgi:NADH-quinone oxidoreductase subunit E
MRVQRNIASAALAEAPDISVDLSLLLPILEKYKTKKGNMIPLLQGTQNLYGFIP